MRGDMPCRRSFAFWKRWHPSGLHSARMLNAAALPLLVMLCLPILCGCSAASSADSRTIPLSPILTSLRPVTLDMDGLARRTGPCRVDWTGGDRAVTGIEHQIDFITLLLKVLASLIGVIGAGFGWWAAGLAKDVKALTIQKLDCNTQYANKNDNAE